MDALRPTAINIMVELRIERMTAGDGDGGAAMGGRIIKLLAGRTIFGERCFGELQLPKMAGKTVPSRAHRKEKEREERYLCGATHLAGFWLVHFNSQFDNAIIS